MGRFTDGMTEEILDWILRLVGKEATFNSAVRLKGSTSSTLYAVTLRVQNTTEKYVVRLFDNREWLQEEPDLAVHEAASLKAAVKAEIPTPVVIAADETGKECGVPAVLMTMLDGHVDLKPTDMGEWLDRLADSLAAIHQVKAEEFTYDYFPYNDAHSIAFPDWSSAPAYWKEAIRIVGDSQPPIQECFIHRDFHPANVLWDNGCVSGVVDWVNACKGPPGVDVGHCRVNLAMLYGVEAADGFLEAYQRHAKDFNYHIYWDLRSLLDIIEGPPEVYAGWADFGVTGLTNGMMEERLDNYVISLVE